MRILFVITRGEERGGAQIHVRDLATELLSHGHDVAVVVGSTGRLTLDLENRNIRFFHASHLRNSLNPYDDIRAVQQIRRVVNDFHPDVVSLHSTKAGLVGRIACRISGNRCLFTAHGWAFTEGVPKLQRVLHLGLEMAVARWCQAVICVSEKDRDLAESARIPHRRRITIHNGMPDIPQALRARPGSHGGPIRVVMTGRLDAQKDHETLLRAVAAVPDIVVTLIGDGPRAADLQSLSNELGIRERVNFTGYSNTVEELLATQDLFVLTSHYEGFPRSTLEAMRAGLPAIVTNVGGSSEAIEPGHTGYVIEPNDVGALVSLLFRLKESPGLLTRMGSAARRRYEELYQFDTLLEKTMSVYRQIL